MRLVLPALLDVSIPLRIGPEPDHGVARLGGRAPAGVSLAKLGSEGRYFATVPLTEDPDRVVSIFIGFTLDQMLDAAGDINSGSAFVENVVHRPGPRRNDRAYESEIAAYSLVLEAPREDMVEDGDRYVVRSSHKIGGRPYFMHGDPMLESAVAALEREGFRQVVQFDLPGAEDEPIAADWPFGDGVFHVLGRPPFGEGDWRAFWEN